MRHEEDLATLAGLNFRCTRHGPNARRRQALAPQAVQAVLAWHAALSATAYRPPAEPEPGAPPRGQVSGATVHAWDTAAAGDWKRRARWPGEVASTSAGPAVDPTLPVEVIVLADGRVGGSTEALALDDPAWTVEAVRARPGALRVQRSALIVLADATIVGLYLTQATDPAIAAVAADGLDLAAACPRTYPLKARGQWYGRHARHKRSTSRGYAGRNWVDGVQRFACPTGAAKQYITAYLPRRAQPGQLDAVRVARVFGGQQTLERRHAPQVAAQRLALAQAADFPGLVPPLPLDALAATYVGVTKGFACPPHCDSSCKGTTETVLWHRPAGDAPFAFSILEHNVVLDVCGAAVLYMSGALTHGTPPNALGTHDTLGLVLMSKRSVLCPTPGGRAANRNVGKQALQPVAASSSCATPPPPLGLA